MPNLFLLVLAGLTGCIREIGPGPDLGECADYPDGVYTYGEIGVGTCLAGPADLRFFQQDGKTWLAVTNADPFINYGSGSLLLIDFDSIDLDVRANPMHEIDAYALEMDPYVGGLGYLEDRGLMLVSGRLSEGAATRDSSDNLWIVDVTDPSSPTYWAEGDSLTLEDDPQPIVIDPERDRAYVLNITDHSVSVISTDTTPLEVFDLNPDAILGPVKFSDADHSGSRAIAEITATGADITTDLWTLSYIDGSYRVWAHEGGGLARWTSGDSATYVASALGVELDPADTSEVEEVVDPWFFTDGGLPSMMFADRGAIRYVQSPDNEGGVPVGNWLWDTQDSLLGGSDDGWDVYVDGPSPNTVDGVPAIYYTGRATDGGPGSIGIALAVDGSTYGRNDEPVLEAPSGLSYEQPFVIVDPFTETFRMWLSVWDGAAWSIATTASDDGLAWTEPQTVLAAKGGDIGAPAITYASGEYRMWSAVRAGDDDVWDVALSISSDGLAWTEPLVVIPGDPDLAAERPPRAAIQPDARSTWRVEGVDSDWVPITVETGGEYGTEHGYSLHVSSGYEIDVRAVTEDRATGGLTPSAYAVVAGIPTLYASAVDSNGRSNLIALQQDWRGEWIPAATDLIPEGAGGNDGGVQSPVVAGQDGDWTMLYGATNTKGATLMRRAHSNDGLTWEPQGSWLVEVESWDAFAQLPHMVQDLGDGTWRVWYGGDNGTLTKVGSLLTADAGRTFTREPGPLYEYRFGTGTPGDFDDSGVRDPWVWEEDGLLHMLYSGFDGDIWRIGYATSADGDEWFRAIDPYTEAVLPSMTGVTNTFSVNGVLSPVGIPDEDGRPSSVWYAGFDGFVTRPGIALRDMRTLYPAQRVPTVGDELTFYSEYGGDVEKVIELGQTVQGFETTGVGAVSATLDPERGFLYVTSKLSDYFYVIDIRDDSDGDFYDANYLDIEAIVIVSSLTGSIGFRDSVVVEDSNLLYLSGRQPDALVAVDLDQIVDDDMKDAVTAAAVAALPVRNSLDDEGIDSLALIGLAGLALGPDERTIFATHFNENSLYVFDLDVSPYGAEVGRVVNIGENPHTVRIHPDGKLAVVANYLGEVVDNTVASTLAVVDIDPESETYLQVLTWLTNH